MIPVLAGGDGERLVDEAHQMQLQSQFPAAGHFECLFVLD
jgi:hypothetical protein